MNNPSFVQQIGEQRFVQILGTKTQKRRFADEFRVETQTLQRVKQQKLTEERQRDFYETQRVQKRQLDDWQRAEQDQARKRALAVQMANENRAIAEAKRQANLDQRVRGDVKEAHDVFNNHYKI